MMYFHRNLWCVSIAIMLISIQGCGRNIQPDKAASETAGTSITILHMNDHHSHLNPHVLEMPIATDELSRPMIDSEAKVRLQYGGFALIEAALNQFANRPTLKLYAGDAVTGTLYYSLFKGAADAAAMNVICWDTFALGNHEFDGGDSGLALFLDYLAEGDCKPAVLAANVRPGPDSALRRGYIKSHAVFEVDGATYGVIGIDIAGKTKKSSFPDEGTEFLNELSTAQAEIDSLREQGINKIILLTHITYKADLELARSLLGVDVVVGGDSHTLLGGDTFSRLGFNPVAPYPAVTTDRAGSPVCVVSAWEYAKVIGALTVEFDAAGTVTRCAGQPIIPVARRFTVLDPEGQEVVLNAEDSELIVQKLERFPEVFIAQPDATMQRVLEDFSGEVDKLQRRIVGSIGEDLCLVRWPGEARSSLCGVMETYHQGSDIANIVAHVFLEMTPSADIAIQNAGGVRTDVPAGPFTVADAYNLLPFANTLVTMNLTGAQIVQVLEEALKETLDDAGSSGSYPYASGLRFEVNASAEFGSRISKVQVNPRLQQGWMSIEPQTIYTVVANNFIAAGQDGYDTFGRALRDGNYLDTYTEYAQGFIEYLERLTARGESLQRLSRSQYSTQVYTGTNGCNHSTSTNCTSF